MQTHIRKAELSDSPIMSDIAAAAYAKYVPLMEQKPAPMLADFDSHIIKDIVFVIETEPSNPIGYAVLQHLSDGIWLDNIAILPEQTGQRLGSVLLDYCEAFASRYSDCIKLYTNIVMTDNRDWYLRRNYRITHQASINGYQRLYFEKSLTPKGN